MRCAVLFGAKTIRFSGEMNALSPSYVPRFSINREVFHDLCFLGGYRRILKGGSNYDFIIKSNSCSLVNEKFLFYPKREKAC